MNGYEKKIDENQFIERFDGERNSIHENFHIFFVYTAIRAVSMGQGQEYHARKMMTECMATGM